MKLLNFELEQPYSTITLRGLGYDWDLHSFADFQGLHLNPTENSLEMVWAVPHSESNAWGCPENKATGCKLIFYNLVSLTITARDDEMPLSEDLTVSSISKADPKETEYRFKDRWEEADGFNLLFEFESERRIEIGAERAELIAIVP